MQGPRLRRRRTPPSSIELSHGRLGSWSGFAGVRQFCGSFSGQIGAFLAFEAGTDARQVTVSVQVVRNARPHRRRSLQAFCKRFSGQERSQVPDRQGADARRDATSGHFVRFSSPGAGALDQVTQVRILEGQSNPARCVCRAFSLPDPVVSADDHAGRVTPSEGNRRL